MGLQTLRAATVGGRKIGQSVLAAFSAVPEPNFSCLPATKNGKLRRNHLCFLAPHYDWLEFPTLLLSLETPADVKQDGERGNGPVNRVGMWEAKLLRRA